MGEWSTDTRDLVAATIAAHDEDIDLVASGRGELLCSCGFVLDLPAPAEPDWEAAWEPMLAAFRAHRADAVLTALTEAGAVLLPPGGERGEVVGWIQPDGGVEQIDWCNGSTEPRPHTHMRTIIGWPDGSVYYGPWREASDA